jgi:GDP-mannose 6-dehydrogenase
MVKYSDNAFHALKVTFANEIGNICKKTGIDSHKVMNIFCADKKLNLSPYYLKPGFAFGGSCLPKDLRALTYKAKSIDLEVPVLGNILASNKTQISHVTTFLTTHKGKKIGFLGLSFKGGTDDLRESPIVEVVEYMIGKGFTIGIFDSYVSIAKLMGANKRFIEKEIPHISSLIYEDVQKLIADSDILVIGNKNDEFKDLVTTIPENKLIVDLVRITENFDSLKAEYYGICW